MVWVFVLFINNKGCFGSSRGLVCFRLGWVRVVWSFSSIESKGLLPLGHCWHNSFGS